MEIEIVLIALAVVLFAGMFLALFFSLQEHQSRNAPEAATAPEKSFEVRQPAFFGKPATNEANAGAVALREIEHYLRQEVLLANLFVDDPTAENLWMAWQPAGISA